MALARRGVDMIMKPERVGPWLEKFVNRSTPGMAYEPLWAMLRGPGDQQEAEQLFAVYEAEIQSALPSVAAFEVPPEPEHFDRYWMPFDVMLVWRLADREFFLGLESSDHDLCIRAGTRPLEPGSRGRQD